MGRNRLRPFLKHSAVGVDLSGSTVNPFTSNGGGVWGVNPMLFFGPSEGGIYKYYKPVNNLSLGLDLGITISAVFAHGEGSWEGVFITEVVNLPGGATIIWFTTPSGNWKGFAIGYGLSLPGVAGEELEYND